jgi:RNA polymerase sigma-70 factor (ECF subfamily)
VQAPLLRYISGVVGRTAADDVLQDAFLQICRKLRWLREPELFRPWTYRIATRASFALLKRERRWSSPDAEASSIDELPARPDVSPELFVGIPELIEQLSPASRAVLLLHYVQDLSIEEAAAVLDIGIGTAKSRLAYGLSCLRKLLER